MTEHFFTAATDPQTGKVHTAWCCCYVVTGGRLVPTDGCPIHGSTDPARAAQWPVLAYAWTHPGTGKVVWLKPEDVTVVHEEPPAAAAQDAATARTDPAAGDTNPDDAAGLQRKLYGVKVERDDARYEVMELNRQLAAVTAERDRLAATVDMQRMERKLDKMRRADHARIAAERDALRAQLDLLAANEAGIREDIAKAIEAADPDCVCAQAAADIARTHRQETHRD